MLCVFWRVYFHLVFADNKKCLEEVVKMPSCLSWKYEIMNLPSIFSLTTFITCRNSLISLWVPFITLGYAWFRVCTRQLFCITIFLSLGNLGWDKVLVSLTKELVGSVMLLNAFLIGHQELSHFCHFPSQITTGLVMKGHSERRVVVLSSI